ncbi:MAG: DUF2344 domain-containing protein [Tissierellia bacterium]|nr:DUF2344 domain-containing protein [Tissierellia bacterium]
MILRVVFTKENYLRYIGHLDLLRLFQRCFNRAGIKLNYSKGFNPRPKFSVANPLSLGVESIEEYMDIDLIEEMDIREFIHSMNAVLPDDIRILRAEYTKDTKSVSAILDLAKYEIKFKTEKNMSKEELDIIIQAWLENEQILISRLRKRKKNKIVIEENIRCLIKEVEVIHISQDLITINALLSSSETGTLRPLDFIEAMDRDNNLAIDMESVMLKRLGLYIEGINSIYKPI